MWYSQYMYIIHVLLQHTSCFVYISMVTYVQIQSVSCFTNVSLHQYNIRTHPHTHKHTLTHTLGLHLTIVDYIIYITTYTIIYTTDYQFGDLGIAELHRYNSTTDHKSTWLLFSDVIPHRFVIDIDLITGWTKTSLIKTETNIRKIGQC